MNMTKDIQDPHHDGLVITLYIANHFVRRILVGGGCSMNIILLDALTMINILESKIIKKILGLDRLQRLDEAYGWRDQIAYLHQRGKLYTTLFFY